MQQLIVFFCIFSWNISKDSQLLSNLAFTKQIWRTKLAQLHPEIPGNYIHFLRTSRWLQAQLKAYNVILTEAACTFCLKTYYDSAWTCFLCSLWTNTLSGVTGYPCLQETVSRVLTFKIIQTPISQLFNALKSHFLHVNYFQIGCSNKRIKSIQKSFFLWWSL